MEKAFIVFKPSEMTAAQLEGMIKLLEEAREECLKQKNSPEGD